MDGGKAHDARLGCRVNFRAFEMGRAKRFARSNDGTDFGMSRGVVRSQDFIVSGGDDVPPPNDASPERTARAPLDPSISFLESELHEAFISTRHSA